MVRATGAGRQDAPAATGGGPGGRRARRSDPLLELQSAFEPLLPPGLQHYWKSDFVAELTEEAIEVYMEYGPQVPTVNATVHLYLVDCAVHDVGSGETAFPSRDARFSLNIARIWPDPEDNEANIAWVREYYEAIHPHSGYEGGYTNFMAEDDQERIRANCGDNYDRLQKIEGPLGPGQRPPPPNQNVRPG